MQAPATSIVMIIETPKPMLRPRTAELGFYEGRDGGFDPIELFIGGVASYIEPVDWYSTLKSVLAVVVADLDTIVEFIGLSRISDVGETAEPEVAATRFATLEA